MNSSLRPKAIFRVLLVSVLAMTFLGAHAAGKVSIMVGGYEKQIYLPAKLAEAPGYFKAEDVMLVGSVQGVIGFYDDCIDLQTKGQICWVRSAVQPSKR